MLGWSCIPIYDLALTTTSLDGCSCVFSCMMSTLKYFEVLVMNWHSVGGWSLDDVKRLPYFVLLTHSWRH